MFGKIQTSQTAGQLYRDTSPMVNVLWLSPCSLLIESPSSNIQCPLPHWLIIWIHDCSFDPSLCLPHVFNEALEIVVPLWQKPRTIREFATGQLQSQLHCVGEQVVELKSETSIIFCCEWNFRKNTSPVANLVTIDTHKLQL